MRTRDLDNPSTVLKYVAHLQAANSHALGFLTYTALREYHERGQIIPAAENDQLIAYALYFDGRAANKPKRDPNTFRIIQLCTDYDARRLKHATHLINQLIDRAQQQHFTKIRAWVADDLPANDFWNAIGFQLAGTRTPHGKRQRSHNLWTLDLHPNPPTPTKTELSSHVQHLIKPIKLRPILDPNATRSQLQRIRKAIAIP